MLDQFGISISLQIKAIGCGDTIWANGRLREIESCPGSVRSGSGSSRSLKKISGSTLCFGPELLGQALVDWMRDYGVFIDYIEPGKANQNAFIERFNRTYREEVLGLYLCSAYDCEFVWLVRDLRVPLVTADRQLIGAFPDTTVPADVFLDSKNENR